MRTQDMWHNLGDDDDTRKLHAIAEKRNTVVHYLHHQAAMNDEWEGPTAWCALRAGEEVDPWPFTLSSSVRGQVTCRDCLDQMD